MFALCAFDMSMLISRDKELMNHTNKCDLPTYLFTDPLLTTRSYASFAPIMHFEERFRSKKYDLDYLKICEARP